MLGIFIQLSLIKIVLSAVSPTWSGTSLIQSGVKQIVINGNHQNGSNLYIYNYSPAFSSTPNTALGIVSMETMDPSESHIHFTINIQQYTSTTQLKLRMNDPTVTTWKTFKASYIAVDSTFSMVRVDYFSVNNPGNVGVGSGQRSYTGIFRLNIGSVDTTHTISIIPLLVGLTCDTANGEHSVSWSTSLRDADNIDYDLTVKGTTAVTSLLSYILVVDKSLLQYDSEQYLDEIYITGTNSISNNEDLIFYDINNIHAGLNSFSFSEISFDLDLGSLDLTTNGAYANLNISVWSYRQRSCNPAKPYYEQIDNVCYATCPSGYVNTDGSTKKFCKPCQQFISGCKLCAGDGSTCSQAFGNYVIVEPANTSCICPTDGFYESSAPEHSQYIDKCRNCHYSCKACSGNLATQCSSCDTGLTLQGDNSCSCDNGNPLNQASSNICEFCHFSCLTCTGTSATQCGSCDTGLTLQGDNSCSCDNGNPLNQASSNICEACHFSCLTCTGTSATQCGTCDTGLTLQGDNSCSCDNGNALNETNFNICGICHFSCLTCTGASATQCGTCDTGLTLQGDNSCSCDNGNTPSSQCSSTICSCSSTTDNSNNAIPTSPQYALVFQIMSIIKQPLHNIINLTIRGYLKLSSTGTPLDQRIQQISLLKQYLQIVPQQYSLTIKSMTYDPASQLLYIQLEYGSSIHGQQITIIFNSEDGTTQYANRLTFVANTDNHIAAAYYTDQYYQGVQILLILAKVIVFASLALAFFCFFYRKMIGLQLTTMLQLIYFGTLLTQYEHPYMSAFHELKYINGWNGLYINNAGITLQAEDSGFNTLGYSQYFIQNYNFMLLLPLVIYLIALILYLISLPIQKIPTKRKLQHISKILIFEVGFALMIFTCINMIVSLYLQIESGVFIDLDYYGGKIMLSIASIIIIAHITLFILHNESSETIYFYKPSVRYTHFYPLLLLGRNILTIILIILHKQIKIAAEVSCICFESLYIIVIVVTRPYQNIVDFVRKLIIQCTLLLYFVYKTVWQFNMADAYDYTMEDLFMGLVIAIYSGLVCCLVATIGCMFWHVVLVWRQAKVIPDQKQEEKSEIKSKKEKENSVDERRTSSRLSGDRSKLIVESLQNLQSVQPEKNKQKEKPNKKKILVKADGQSEEYYRRRKYQRGEGSFSGLVQNNQNNQGENLDSKRTLNTYRNRSYGLN